MLEALVAVGKGVSSTDGLWPIDEPFDAAAAGVFGQVASSLRRSGRKPAARAFDALIAAVAMANGLPVYTCDPGDFAGIDGLVIRMVAVPGEPR